MKKVATPGRTQSVTPRELLQNTIASEPKGKKPMKRWKKGRGMWPKIWPSGFWGRRIKFLLGNGEREACSAFGFSSKNICLYFSPFLALPLAAWNCFLCNITFHWLLLTYRNRRSEWDCLSIYTISSSQSELSNALLEQDASLSSRKISTMRYMSEITILHCNVARIEMPLKVDCNAIIIR